jgi:glutamate/tyrosine decarboxylase-like PLP-dependent enzyme
LGYAPYPAGIIAFKNGLVTELIQQRAPYISDVVVGIKNVDELPPITAVGPYILEGSNPGSVALGCWLAHKTIPLTTHGHGKIIRTSLLNSKKLFKYLVNHRHMFRRMHFDNFKTCECTFPFTFVPLFEPDTNVVCFVAKPMRWHSGQLTDTDILLADLNELGQRQ